MYLIWKWVFNGRILLMYYPFFDQIITLCYLPTMFWWIMIYSTCQKVTSLCQTFNQSLYNTIYLRFSFEYLFENFIIVSLHMCIRYFFILFYFSYSSRQIVYFFCCINCNVCTTHFFVLHHPVLEFVRKIYEICTFLVLTWKRKILKMQV